MGKTKSESIQISGASDDLVEVARVSGRVAGCNEYPGGNDPVYVELGTGDVFRVAYTDRGVWTVDLYIDRTPSSAAMKYTKVPHGDGDDPDPYTDTVTVTAKEIGWVEVWEAYPPTAAEKRKKLARFLTDGDPDIDSGRLLTDDEIDRMWAIAVGAVRRKELSDMADG